MKIGYHLQTLDLSYCVLDPAAHLPDELQDVVLSVDRLVLREAQNVDVVFGKTLAFKTLEQ